MVLCVLFFAVMDAIGKKQSDALPTFQVLFLRSAIILALSALWMRMSGIQISNLFSIPDIELQSFRGIVWALTALWFYLAFAGGSLASVYLISFLHPAAAIFFAWALRGQRARASVFLPIALMFFGIYVSLGSSEWSIALGASLFAFLAAIFFGLEAALTKQIEQTEQRANEIETLAFSALVGALVFSIGIAAHHFFWMEGISAFSNADTLSIVTIEDTVGIAFRPIGIADSVLLVLQGTAGFAGNLALIYAYNFANEDLLAPIDYLIVIFGAVIGFLFFGDTLSLTFWIGASIIVLGGVWLSVVSSKE